MSDNTNVPEPLAQQQQHSIPSMSQRIESRMAKYKNLLFAVSFATLQVAVFTLLSLPECVSPITPVTLICSFAATWAFQRLYRETIISFAIVDNFVSAAAMTVAYQLGFRCGSVGEHLLFTTVALNIGFYTGALLSGLFSHNGESHGLRV